VPRAADTPRARGSSPRIFVRREPRERVVHRDPDKPLAPHPPRIIVALLRRRSPLVVPQNRRAQHFPPASSSTEPVRSAPSARHPRPPAGSTRATAEYLLHTAHRRRTHQSDAARSRAAWGTRRRTPRTRRDHRAGIIDEKRLRRGRGNVDADEERHVRLRAGTAPTHPRRPRTPSARRTALPKTCQTSWCVSDLPGASSVSGPRFRVRGSALLA